MNLSKVSHGGAMFVKHDEVRLVRDEFGYGG